MKRIIALILIIALLSISVRAATSDKTFTTKINVTTDNSILRIHTEDRNLELACSLNQTIPFSIEFKRTIDAMDCDAIDYDKISIMLRAELAGKGLNITVDGLKTDTVSELLSEYFKNQQDYIQNTYIKKVEEYTALGMKNKDLTIELDLSNSKLRTLQNELNVTAYTYNMLISKQEDEIKSLWIVAMIISVGCIILIARQFIDWDKIKNITRKV